MKPNPSGVLSFVLALALAVGASAQASKFAAAWDNDTKMVHAFVASGSEAACLGQGEGSGTAGDPCILAESLMARIDVPQSKDLLIGVSGQIGLHTFTQAKGKSSDPTVGKASASGSVVVTVELRDPDTQEVLQVAAPGPVTFAARLQELSVDVSGGDIDAPTDVIIGLLLDTTAAHHFNFVGVDLDVGNYDVVAVFNLSAFVAIVGDDAIAEAQVTLGPRMVTAQEVRAAKGALVAFD